MRITKITLYSVVSFALYVLNAIWAVHAVGSMLIHRHNPLHILYWHCASLKVYMSFISYYEQYFKGYRILQRTNSLHTHDTALYFFSFFSWPSKRFFICFLPYILTLTVRIPMRMMQWYFEHFRMSPEGLPGSGLTSWVNVKSFTHYRRWTFCPIFILLGLHDPFYSPRLWWTWDGAINKVGGRWHGQSMQAISSKGLLTKPSGPCRH